MALIRTPKGATSLATDRVKPSNAGLGRRVVRQADAAGDAVDGRQGHNRALTPGNHIAQGGPGRVEHPEQHDLELPQPLLVGEVEDRRCLRVVLDGPSSSGAGLLTLRGEGPDLGRIALRPGAVDDHVDVPVAVGDAREGVVHRSRVRHVARYRDRVLEVAGHRVRALGVDIEDDHLGAAAREPPATGGADPGRAAGHDRDLASEVDATICLGYRLRCVERWQDRGRLEQ
jgi:hypothetical protein